MNMTDDIDALAGTRRRAIVAKALRAEHPERGLHTHMMDARAVLEALDEDDADQYEMTAEQEIRGYALTAAARLLTQVAAEVEPSPAGIAAFIELWLTAAEAGTTFIDTGRNVFSTDAEPTPPLDGEGAADGQGDTEGSSA